jgi:hypothetical protein
MGYVLDHGTTFQVRWGLVESNLGVSVQHQR